mmetsp:Transcript_7595/g.10890  ORF Transcript_7595/g.10890 Transcript_7595/m.10890 type:complete len:147 (-) Transcript_7595:26-466(-)
MKINGSLDKKSGIEENSTSTNRMNHSILRKVNNEPLQGEIFISKSNMKNSSVKDEKWVYRVKRLSSALYDYLENNNVYFNAGKKTLPLDVCANFIDSVISGPRKLRNKEEAQENKTDQEILQMARAEIIASVDHKLIAKFGIEHEN